MATGSPDHLSGIDDPQRPVAIIVGLLLIVVGVAGLTGILDVDIGFGPGLVAGAFGIPFWLGVTAIVAGGLGILLSTFEGGATTFDKVAAGLVLPAVLLLAVVDWGLAVGSLLSVGLGLIALVLAVALVGVGLVLLYGRLLALVLPVVAVLALADWAFGITETVPTTEAVNLPTIGLLAVLAVVVGLVAFEGGRRTTRLE